MEEIKYQIRVTDDMKFIVFDVTNEEIIKIFENLEQAREYMNQLNKK